MKAERKFWNREVVEWGRVSVGDGSVGKVIVVDGVGAIVLGHSAPAFEQSR